MKKQYIYLLIALLLAGTQTNAQTSEGIEIDGITWAASNVAQKGVFAAQPQDIGGYFDFDVAQGVCPEGWRVPGNDELDALRASGSEWTTLEGVAGRLFASKLFIPAAGRRDLQGAVEQVGEKGYVWSEMPLRNGYFGYCFYIERVGAYNYEYECEYGMSVRCVKE